MKCPVCGTPLEFNEKLRRYVCSKCDVFKQIYQPEWKRHQDNVNRLADEIKIRFPIVSLKMGLGAVSKDWVDIPPDKKNEPDIEVWWKVHILSIEVTGSAKVKVPPSPIWILAKKLSVARESVAQHKDYIFYGQFSNNRFVVPVSLVEKYRENIKVLSNAQCERYIQIPPQEAMPNESLYQMIEKRLNGLLGVQVAQPVLGAKAMPALAQMRLGGFR